MKEYRVTVRRQNGAGESWLQTYVVKDPENGLLSVMNVLDEISSGQDPTLAYFDHAACHQAACGKCALRVNGKPRLACKEPASLEMLLEPLNDRIVRDLVCRN